MITVEIHNFQSIEDLTLEIDGFTCLAGKSNIGKSATVRAVKAALTNTLGTSFVRHGPACARRLKGNKTCKCVTTVRIIREGFDLLWEKGDSVNRYTYNGKVYDKPGTGTPEFLAEAGLSPVKMGDSTINLNVGDQFHPIFMLDQSGTAVAEMISDVSKLDKVSLAIKAADKDRREAVSTRKLREKDLQAAKQRLLSFEGLPQVTLQVADVVQGVGKVQAYSGRLSTVEGYLSRNSQLHLSKDLISKALEVPVPELGTVLSSQVVLQEVSKYGDLFSSKGQAYKKLNSAIKSLEGLPDIAGVTSAYSTLNLVSSWLGRFQGLGIALQTLKGTLTSPLPESIDLQGQLSALTQRGTYCRKLLSLKSAVGSLEPATSNPLPDLPELRAAQTKAISCNSYLVQLSKSQTYLVRLRSALEVPVPEEVAFKSLQDKVVKCSQYIERLVNIKKDLARLKEEEVKVQELERAVWVEVKELGVCPTCSQPFKANPLGSESCCE